MENNISKKQNNQYLYLSYDDFFKDDYKKYLILHPIVEGMFNVGEISAIIGDTQTGKTFGALYIAYQLATETESIFEQKIYYRNRPVLYIASESYSTVIYRYIALRQKFQKKDKISIYSIRLNGLAKLDTNELSEIIGQWKEKNPTGQMVFIDTMSASGFVEQENSNDEMAKFISKVSLINEKYQTHICFIQHTSKGNKENSRGASAFECNIDFALLFQKNDNIRNFIIKKTKDLKPFDERFFDITSVSVSCYYQTDEGLIDVQKNIGIYAEQDKPVEICNDKKLRASRVFALAYLHAEKHNLLLKDNSLPLSVLNDFTKNYVKGKGINKNFWTSNGKYNGFDLLKDEFSFNENDKTFKIYSGSVIERSLNYVKQNDVLQNEVYDFGE